MKLTFSTKYVNRPTFLDLCQYEYDYGFSGVEIYEYLPGFIHEKTVISDDKYLIVGTVNLDYRSLVHHFEDGVFVIDSPVVDEAKKCYLETVQESDFRDNDEARLTPVEWVIRNLIKIFAPLL